MSEVTVRTADGLELAVRDHGGDGPDVVLVHGAMRNLEDWALMLPHLPGRKVSVDLRGHGRSDEPDRWSWDGLVADIEAVVSGLALDEPFIVGHSLGGSAAGRYAKRHPECPGAVSLDGFGFMDTDLYEGIDAAEIKGFMAAFEANASAQRPSQLEGDTSWRDAAIAQVVPFEFDAEAARAVHTRNFIEIDGRWRRRPPASFYDALMTPDIAKDALNAYEGVRCRFLFVKATKIMAAPGDVGKYFEALNAGVLRRLSEMSAANPLLRVASVDATHFLNQEAPEATAEIITDFIEGA